MDAPQSELRHSVFREAHLRDYWKVVWQGRWTILAIFMVIVGITAVWTFLQTPIYRATATIEVQPQVQNLVGQRDVSGLGAGGYGWFAEEKYHNTQVEIIKSRDVAQRVVDNLDLESDPMFEGVPDVVDAFRKSIQVVPRRETGLIEVSIMGPDPEQITHWVNEVAEAYVRRNFDKAQENMTQAVKAIETQLASLETQFSDAESQRFQKLEDSPIFNVEDQGEIVRDKLKTFNAQLTEVQIELSRLEDTLQQIRDMRQRGADLMSLPALAEDPILKELDTAKVELERELESDKVELRPGHPNYEKKVSQLVKLQQRIQDRRAVVLGTLETEYGLAVAKERYLREQIRRAEDFSLEVAKASSDYGLDKTRAETKKRILDLITKTMNEIGLGAQLLNNNISVLDKATVPRYAIEPRKRVNLAIGAMLGLFLGVAAAFFLDYLDNTFRTPEDIEKYLHLSVLGVIPKSDEQGIAHRAVKEAYQSLRTSVIFCSKNRRRKVVLITSTGPQEGKSSTVANLARTMAATGERVIVLDCDLRKPTQHVHHGLERDAGISNFLAAPVESTDWSGYVKTSNPSNLHVLTSGAIPPSPPELLGVERFKRMLREVSERYDWVLLDSPPAASLADATLLAELADMVVLIVQHYHTDRDLVSKTLQRIRSVKDNVVGAVLNNVDLERAYRKDYYYAGYYYYGDEKSGGRRGRKKRGVEKKASVG
jgi:capsular exopolysaccharide synthesis family protein